MYNPYIDQMIKCINNNNNITFIVSINRQCHYVSVLPGSDRNIVHLAEQAWLDFTYIS